MRNREDRKAMKSLPSGYKSGQYMLVKSIVQKYAHMAKEVQLIKCNTMYRTFAPEELISAELYGHWHVHTFDYNPVTCSLGIWTVE